MPHAPDDHLEHEIDVDHSLIALAERGLIPNPLIRLGIKRLLRQRLVQEHAQDSNARRSPVKTIGFATPAKL